MLTGILHIFLGDRVFECLGTILSYRRSPVQVRVRDQKTWTCRGNKCLKTVFLQQFEFFFLSTTLDNEFPVDQ